MIGTLNLKAPSWIKYDNYDWKETVDGKLYLTPSCGAVARSYDPLEKMDEILVAAIQIGRLFMKGCDSSSEVREKIRKFAENYGLLGIMNALHAGNGLKETEQIFLSKNLFIREESLSTREFHTLFFPFEKNPTEEKNIIESSTNPCFLMGYSEQYEWLRLQFLYWTYRTSVVSIRYYDGRDIEKNNFKLPAEPTFEKEFSAYHIGFLDKPTLFIDSDSLLSVVQMMLDFSLVGIGRALRLCRRCGLPFYSSRQNAAFCSSACRNQYNVYTARLKNKEKKDQTMRESQNVEWKVKWRDEYLEWICGFANAQGGRLYIGCDDDGNVVGIPNGKRLLEDIPNQVRSTMGILVEVNLQEKNEKEYLEIVVPAYPVGISYKGIFYYRSGSTRQILSGSALEAFLLKKRGTTWDGIPLPAFNFNDIEKTSLDSFRKLALKKGRIDSSIVDERCENLMEKLHLVKDGFLTNAAMLLFSKDPENWQLGAYIKVGYFQNDSDLLYQDEVHGPLLEQVEKTLELVYFKYLKAKITYEGMQRVERYFVPMEAFREALINAVCHKNYQSGIPIQVSVYEDKLYIANVGSLPEDWTLEKLMSKHASTPYNPNIANVFYLAGYIESWGRGIEKICSVCRAEGLVQPEYSITSRDIMIEFKAPEDRVVKSSVSKPVEGISVKEKEILDCISEDPGYTLTQMSEKLGISRKTISERIRKMKQNGLIERVGTNKNGHWLIKDI